MKAIEFSAPRQVAEVDIPAPKPGPTEVIVRVAACGICGTDLHILDGELASLPVIPGHEFAGEVVEQGPDVREPAVGAHVAVDPGMPCRSCAQCRAGRPNLCLAPQAIGVTVAGGAAEYVRVPAANCYRLPDGSDLEQAALLEPLACVVAGFDRIGACLGKHLLVFGAGTIGLMAVMLAQSSGAVSVSVIELREERLAAAVSLGCDAAETDAQRVIRQGGWDVVIDCTGAPKAVEDGIQRVARRGTSLQLGVSAPNATVQLSPFAVFRDELTVVGSNSALNSFDRAIDLFGAEALDLDALIGDRLPLGEYAEGVNRLRRGDGGKTLVLPRGN